jgi:hypothetical protein
MRNIQTITEALNIYRDNNPSQLVRAGDYKICITPDTEKRKERVWVDFKEFVELNGLVWR